MSKWWAVAVVLLLGQEGVALALEPGRKLEQYVRTTWTVDRGLPQSTVVGVTQSADGYIWIATQEGFVRFDGSAFVTFDKNSHPQLLSNISAAIRVARDGVLYVGTSDGGLVRMRDGRIDLITEVSGLPSNTVQVLHEGRDGSLWIGTSSGLARLSDGEINAFPAEDFLNKEIMALAEDSEGQLWIATVEGLATLRGGRLQRRMPRDGFPSVMVQALTATKDGSIWMGTEGEGLYRYRPEGIKTYGLKDGLPSLRAGAVYEDRRGTIWIGTADKGFGRLRNGRVEFDSQGKDPVLTFFEDREGNLWIGRAGGLDRLADGVVIPYSRSEGLLDDNIKSVSADRHGTVWVGTREGVTDLEGNHRLWRNKGLSSSHVLSTWAARDDSLWIGTADGGLNHVEKSGTTTYSIADGLPSDSVLALFEDRRGVMWVGTSAGLARVSNGVLDRNGIPAEVPRDSTSVISESRDGSIWVGSHERGLTRIHRNGAVETFTTEHGLSNNWVVSIHEDSAGTIWIGTIGGGLNRFKNNMIRAITSRNGLQDDSVFAILEDRRGNLWMSSNKGIFRASVAALNQVADGTRPKVFSVMYGRSDGMRSRECNGGAQPVAWQTPNGMMWFATTDGLAAIDPERALLAAAAAPVMIGEIYADGALLAKGAPVPAGHRTLELHYTSATFKTSDKLRFRYKLEDFDKDWTDAQTRRVAYYTNVTPGQYRFRVQVINGEGVATPESTTAVAVEPFFYQTPLFWLLVAASLIAAAWAAHQWRIGLIRASAERFKLLFDRNLAGVYRARIDGRILDCNNAFLRIFGLSSVEELNDRSIFDFYATPADGEELVRRLREDGAASGVETALQRADGKPMWVLQNVSMAPSLRGQEILEATVIDLSDRKEAEEKIRYLAYHDGLTGLPNRALFKDRLSLAVPHAERRNRHVAVLFLDLDRFKIINDTLGHTIGDHLLEGMAERLASCVREEDSVARVGGDEFTILLVDLGRPADAMTVAQKVLDEVARPLIVDGHELYVTCSIGISMSPNDGIDAETLLKNADNALYRAKEAGKNNYQLCTPSMTQLAAERLAVEGALRQAIDRNEFFLVYQPQYDLKTRKIVAVEALLRWNRPGVGMVGPVDFIAAAEESRLIVPIGEFVLDAALQQARSWAGDYPIRIAVNVSAPQFRQRHLVRAVRDALLEYSVDPKRLEIEITESTAMQNPAATAEILQELKALGVSVVIDDFGIGHSSLNYLKRFPIDGLKIDRTFVQDMITDTSDAGIVSAVIAMAHALNLRVTAEGVETVDQLNFLDERGCTSIQGYLLSRPVSAEAVTVLLQSGARVMDLALQHTA